jgi:hypothetical protein
LRAIICGVVCTWVVSVDDAKKVQPLWWDNEIRIFSSCLVYKLLGL